MEVSDREREGLRKNQKRITFECRKIANNEVWEGREKDKGQLGVERKNDGGSERI